MDPPPKPPKKLPACDRCKARRVLCHPQPNGVPCPRCAEKNEMCTTTPTQRGRPRKYPLQTKPVVETRVIKLPQNPGPVFQSSFNCPELTPEFVAHCFDVLKLMPQYNHPLIEMSMIKKDIRTASYRLELLHPSLRVLALAIICAASLASFHPSVLGDGPRPTSLADSVSFFASASTQDLLGCGLRRAPAFQALRNEAFKAAWETGVMLQPSVENAAACFLLDLMEQVDFVGVSRPWATAYMAHVRTLAPGWHASGQFGATDAVLWSAFILSESIISAIRRTPLLVTPHDQSMLCGPEPPDLGTLLTMLSKVNNPSFGVFWSFVQPCEFIPLSSSLHSRWINLISTLLHTVLFHVTAMSRQLSEKIAGDYARLAPLNEAAAITFLTSLTTMQALLSQLLTHAEVIIGSTAPSDQLTTEDDPARPDLLVRASAFALMVGHTGLCLPFYRELEYRDNTAEHAAQRQSVTGIGTPLVNVVDVELSPATRARVRLLRDQARELAVDAAQTLSNVLSLLPRGQFTPIHYHMIHGWAQFCLEEAEEDERVDVELAHTMEAFSKEIKYLSYSLHGIATPTATPLIDKLDAYVLRASTVMRRASFQQQGPFVSEFAEPDAAGSMSASPEQFPALQVDAGYDFGLGLGLVTGVPVAEGVGVGYAMPVPLPVQIAGQVGNGHSFQSWDGFSNSYA
ncbi:Zn(2)-C6 fungal-type domain-containing protein [Mycena chlorophos]|uniref:Zn(2)-C6 fungal-type domain-containing protein n=1 Tax=Mycena chlorophos TaxID=658473 RepID=A0A8H6SUH2_MYCCL|nr:Zn(2)-C6 fungal-type domain-containing protein [Mycena chlorophos]